MGLWHYVYTFLEDMVRPDLEPLLEKVEYTRDAAKTRTRLVRFAKKIQEGGEVLYCASTKEELSAHPALSLIVGRYAATGDENHGKLVYKKISAAADTWDVHLYH